MGVRWLTEGAGQVITPFFLKLKLKLSDMPGKLRLLLRGDEELPLRLAQLLGLFVKPLLLGSVTLDEMLYLLCHLVEVLVQVLYVLLVLAALLGMGIILCLERFRLGHIGLGIRDTPVALEQDAQKDVSEHPEPDDG